MDFLPLPERFYAGEFRHSLDEKNRVTIPSRWRRDQAEEFILLPQANHQFLLVISPEDFARMSSAVESNEGVPRAIVGFSCASCTPARSTPLRIDKGVLSCRKSFAGRLD